MIPDEREWQAQEMAMRCERAGVESPASDMLVAAYLPIAQALNKPLDPLLPADFAARVAALAATVNHSGEAESKFEQWLLLGLAIIFGACALVAAMIYGSDWLGNSFDILAQVSTTSLAWPMLLATCLAVSWFTEALRNRNRDPDHGHSTA
jgi:hypothetical protein